ncbi:MAG: enoyl-CoA hydratase-related protein [Sporichthyaceae bacterium]
MAEYEYVRVSRHGAVERIELHRPESLNAWMAPFADEVAHAVRTASDDAAVRAILIAGAGRAFSAGADVKAPREYLPNGDPDLTTRLKDHYNPVILAVREAPKPVIGCVQGAAAGLGVSLALACDLVVMGESSYFLLAFVNIAVMPDAGVLRFLAERVGLARAAELAMLGERLPAAKALDWGLANYVHPDDELQDAALALATRLANGPTVALANIKRTLNETTQADLRAQVEIEAHRQQDHARTHDWAEGRTAFAEKRKAVFTGR